MEDTKQTFEKYMADEFETMEMYTKAIAKVHGPHHPEIIEVRQIFETIHTKLEQAEQEGKKADLDNEFQTLRKLTDGYEAPADTCETAVASYQMLEKAEELYQQQ